MVILLKSLLLRVHIGLIHHQNPKSKTIMLVIDNNTYLVQMAKHKIW